MRYVKHLKQNVCGLHGDEYKNNETQMIKAITMSRIDEYEIKLGKFYQDALLQIYIWKLDLVKCKNLKVQRYVPANCDIRLENRFRGNFYFLFYFIVS
jgi:hypothetical protein